MKLLYHLSKYDSTLTIFYCKTIPYINFKSLMESPKQNKLNATPYIFDYLA